MTERSVQRLWKCPQICFIHSEIACRNACAQLKSETVLAFGVMREYRRILIAAEDGRVFLFDSNIGAMRNCLQEILASTTQKKIVWDCRAYNMLFPGITLSNIIDVQILYFEYCTPSSNHLSDISAALDFPGRHIIGDPFEREIVQLIVRSHATDAQMTECCAVNIMYLHRMHARWASCLENDHLVHLSSLRLNAEYSSQPIQDCDFKKLLIPLRSGNEDMRRIKFEIETDHELDLRFKFKESTRTWISKHENSAQWEYEANRLQDSDHLMSKYGLTFEEIGVESRYNQLASYKPPPRKKTEQEIWTCPLVFFIETDLACMYACNHLKKQASLAIDIEWVVKRHKRIPCTLQIATQENDIYLFDLLLCKGCMSHKPLRQILESSKQEKFLWDCRGDAEVLKESFGVTLRNVVDVQILFYESYTPGGDYLPSLLKALEQAPIASSLEQEDVMNIKREGKHSLDLMERRPLSMKLVHYCAVDIMCLHCMRYKWYSALERDHMELISDRRISQGNGSGCVCDFKDLLTPKIRMEFDPEEIERREFDSFMCDGCSDY